MKLIDLHPRWTGVGDFGYEIIDGVSFDCPHCKTQRLAVKFTPPIDRHDWGGKQIEFPIYPLQWKRVGDTFETLTLSPSVDASSRIDFQNHWHGHIQNGEVI